MKWTGTAFSVRNSCGGLDYRDRDGLTCRLESHRLYEHPLFEERLDIPESNLEDLTTEVLLISSMLQEIDPLSYFESVAFLHRELQMPDGGSALFFLRTGYRLLKTLEVPIRTQIRIRNILEMTFDEIERTTQQERFKKPGIYPDIASFCDPDRLDGCKNNLLLLPAKSVYQLRLKATISSARRASEPTESISSAKKNRTLLDFYGRLISRDRSLSCFANSAWRRSIWRPRLTPSSGFIFQKAIPNPSDFSYHAINCK